MEQGWVFSIFLGNFVYFPFSVCIDMLVQEINQVSLRSLYCSSAITRGSGLSTCL